MVDNVCSSHNDCCGFVSVCNHERIREKNQLKHRILEIVIIIPFSAYTGDINLIGL